MQGQPTLLNVPTRWLDKFLNCTQLFVGLSGGLDSTVLLHWLAHVPLLKSKLRVIHVNHGLGPNDHDWEQRCKQLCQTLDLPLISQQVQCKQDANQEAAAREARYGVFDRYVHAEDALILGHHQQDQAETVLLNLFRGTGIDGLCGMWEETTYRGYPIFRPFLAYTRADLTAYAAFYKLSWIEDESNMQLKYDRNFIRHQVMPLLAERWPQVIDKLASVTAHAQQAEQNLQQLALISLPNSDRVFNYGKLSLSSPRLSNVLWYWLKAHKVAPLNQNMVQRIMTELILNPAACGLKIEFLHDDVCCYKKKLYLIAREKQQHPIHNGTLNWTSFPESYVLPNQLGQLTVNAAQPSLTVPPNAQIEIRFRQGGETFRWHNQTKTLKKLWQAWGVPVWERETTPLIYINGILAAVVGWAVSDLFFTHEVGGVTIEWRRP